MSTEREFTVAIYANEYKQICAWVLKQQSLETGGDLFGLWSGDHSAVIQLVLGPGRNCQRAAHSFYQDVGYLEKVGSNLTGTEGVCHIGEWHSHHTIGLKRPSGGDERTVWTNMPTYGLSRFILFIANIETRSYEREAVSVGCFLFEFVNGTNRKLDVLQGKFHLLANESPFRSKCLSVLEKEAECLNRNEEVESLDLTAMHTGSNMDAQRPVMGIQEPRKRRKPRKSRKHKGEDVRVDIKKSTEAIKTREEPETKNKNEEGTLFRIVSRIRRRCPFCALL